jgi:hypothetical protein
MLPSHRRAKLRVVLSEEEVQKDTERRAAILASLEWQRIVDGLSEVEVEQER